jgi:hypothetical protein
MRNLFTSLERYAKENFATESLAYFLENDARIRNGFLTLLGSKRPQSVSLRAFKLFDIRTQVPYHGAIIDLEIAPEFPKRPTDKKLLIEVKTESLLTQSQVNRYLKLRAGYVACLTPLAHPLVSSHKAGYLGHFYWQDVYSIIERNRSRNLVYQEFLNYLKERNMSPQPPFTRKELTRPSNAVDFLLKSQALVQKVQSEILDFWEDEFGINWANEKLTNDFESGDASSWWYRARGWYPRGCGSSLFLEFGVAVKHTPNNTPHFFVGIGTWHGKFGSDLSRDLEEKREVLKKHRWTPYPKPWREWGYRKFFDLTAEDIDKAAKRQIRNVRRATYELQQKDMQIINLVIHRLRR